MIYSPMRAALLCIVASATAPVLALDVAALAAVATGKPEFSLLFDDLFQIPLWGVPVTTFGAAATGAGLSLVIGEPLTHRQMWGQVLLSMFFGVAFATLVADAMDLQWATKHPSLFALVAAGLTRWFMPAVYDRGKQLIAEFTFSFGKKKDTP